MRRKITLQFFMVFSICTAPIILNLFSLLDLQLYFLLNTNYTYKLNIKAWIQNGNSICVDPAKQNSIYMTIFNNNSVFIIWKDHRNEVTGGDIFGQVINSDGIRSWESNGKPVINVTGKQNPKGLIYSGLDCAIYIWEDNRSSNYDIYAQKINLITGNNLWEVNKTIICNEINDQTEPDIVSDNYGGAIISWIDERDGGSTLFVQRINSTGSFQWGDNGTLIVNKTNSIISSPRITTDGLNGSILTWIDNRTGYNSVYCQRINFSGSIRWKDNGTSILNLENLSILNLGICEDGQNGCIVVWADNRTSVDFNIFAQRINSSGYVPNSTRWLDNGTVICNAEDNQRGAEVIYDGKNGAILVWQDYRKGFIDSDIFSQKINSTGDYIWDKNGSAICEAASNQNSPKLTSDGNGGAIFTWIDKRYGDYRIYGQRIDRLGEINWTKDGVLICKQKNKRESPIITFNNNSSYISWIDYRTDGNLGDIYIQRILVDGRLLYNVPLQIIPFFPESPAAFYQEIWFYLLISLIVIDSYVVYYYLIKKEIEEEKIIERKK